LIPPYIFEQFKFCSVSTYKSRNSQNHKKETLR